MENFIEWLFANFTLLLYTLTEQTVNLIDGILVSIGSTSIVDFDINLVLFSDTPILTLDGYDFIATFFSVFYSIIFIICVYKIIKKIFVKITGWKKW